ncbi:MAG TPA: helix-turn-helix domain-containing protein [Terriglobales bacterium]|nr:helix-turn-helix domain-containing protein [Terriglobales bacterium]
MLTQRISSAQVRATRYDRKPLEVLDWHEHRNLSFCFLVKGNYQETTSSQTLTCLPGDVVVKEPNVRHLNNFGDQGAVCLLLEISEDLLKTSTALAEPKVAGLVQNPYLARIGLELREELQFADHLSPAMLDGLALRSMVSLLRLRKERQRRATQVESIRELLDSGETPEEATRQYLTASEKTAMRRLFYKTQGCSMHTYVLRRRALRAFDELLHTDHSLAEIAVRCGFYDQAHFTKVFSVLFGVTPGRLRSRAHYQ